MVSSLVSKLAEPGTFGETIQQHYRAHMQLPARWQHFIALLTLQRPSTRLDGR
jgi:hypothetical protein